MPPKRVSTRGGKASTSTDSGDAQVSAPETSTVTNNAAQNEDSSAAAAEPAASTPSIRRLDTLQSTSLGSVSSRGRGAPGRPIARPRGIGRRSQKDRVDLEKAEQERRQAEAATKARETAWKQRRDLARRGSTRGRMRGGYAGETERRKDTSSSAVSGPFSLGEVSKSKGARPVYSGTGQARGSGGGGGGGGSGGGGSGGLGAGVSSSSGTRSFKQEPGSAMTDVHIKSEDGGYVSSDDDTPGVRKLNIDNLVDLTAEDEGRNSAYLPPVRIQRKEHKERVLVSNAEAINLANGAITKTDDTSSIDKRRGAQHNQDFEITGESHRYRGTYTDSSSEDEGQIKPEPVEDENRPVVPDAAMQSPPTSPETRRKAKERIKTGLSETSKPDFQTAEEELEWDIRERDLRILRTELGQMALPPSAMNTAEQSQDVNGTGGDPRADKVYLFQLPAVLPALVQVMPKVEDEDINMQEVPKVGATEVDSKTTKHANVNRGNDAFPSGLVGKLRVHASGRAYLDWGGMPMQVSMGQEASFLQDVFVLDSKDLGSSAGTKVDGDVTGMALSMGQVKGKFVVVPDWDTIFEEMA